MTKLPFSENHNGVGVTVHEANIATGITAAQVLQIQDLLNRHRVVVIPNQTLTDEQLQDFAFKFGPPFVPDDKSPVLGSKDSAGSIVVVGNQAHEFAKSYLGHQEVLPHSDHQWLRCPSSASLLYALDIEEGSPPTIWTDMVKAYSLLDSETQRTINELQLTTFNPFYRPFGSVSAKYVDRREDVPPGETFSHPLVRTHPLNHEKVLYLNLAYEMEIAGISYEDGKRIWSMLCDHVEQLSFRYEHHWKKGDLVFWDNRATIHYRPSFDSTVRRVLKRVTIGGEIPF